MEMTKKIYLETLKSALGRSIYHYCREEFIRLVLLVFRPRPTRRGMLARHELLPSEHFTLF